MRKYAPVDLWPCTHKLILAGSCFSSAPKTVITSTLAAVPGHVGRRWTSSKLCQHRATVPPLQLWRQLLQLSTYSVIISVSIHQNVSFVACKGETQRFNLSNLSHKLLFPAIHLLRWICVSTSSKRSRKCNKIRLMMYGRVVRFLSIFCRIFQLFLTLSCVCVLRLAILP